MQAERTRSVGRAVPHGPVFVAARGLFPRCTACGDEQHHGSGPLRLDCPVCGAGVRTPAPAGRRNRQR